MLERPQPPEVLIESSAALFLPAPELEAWLRLALTNEDAVFFNEDHWHLRLATIGVLWTNVKNARGGTRIVGQAEKPMSRGGWGGARADFQIKQWFGKVPDFILTFDARYMANASNRRFCALAEHELYHCGFAQDQYGAPRFAKSGKPIFAMRPHDVEEFVPVVARWGASAGAGQTRALIEAGNQAPEIETEDLHLGCGTCGR